MLKGCMSRLRKLQQRGGTKAERARNAKEKAEERRRAAAVTRAEQWASCLSRRKAQMKFDDLDGEDYRQRSTSAARALKRKFPVAMSAPTTSWQSPLAAAFTRYACFHSWQMCPECQRMQPVKFRPALARAKARPAPLGRACRYCQKGIGYWAPSPADVPKPLRRLAQPVIEALRMFAVNIGRPERAYGGYHAHTAATRFSWEATSVEERLAALPKQHWRQGQKAFEYLVEATDNSYREFLQAHSSFLRRHQRDVASGDVDPSTPIPFLPMNFLETVGLECAVWPHLYWRTDMCETYIRSQDIRRRQRGEASHREATNIRGDSSASASAESDEDELENMMAEQAGGRQSAKASFLAKVFSSVIGYGADRELGQFVYDLWLWSSLGAAKHVSGTTLRGALASKSFSPAYWQTLHQGLVDCVAQIGFPHLFITIAPYEPSAPYHSWLEDELDKMLRTRTNLPAAETFHLAHLLLQTAEGLICGTNKQEGRVTHRWTDHILAAEQSGKTTVKEIFGRLEFQDGKRQRHVGPAQSYHGSGRAHLHLLVWLEDAAAVAWPTAVRADLPHDEPELHDLVEGSQLDWDDSAWPLREEPTEYDSEQGRLRLHHPADAKKAKVRAWMPDVLGSMCCHMDVQTGDGRNLLLQYASSYSAKFSDQFATSWLNEEASDYHLARRILSEYHPLEPEMWLQLAGQTFRQVVMTGVVRRINVKIPWKEVPDRQLQAYMDCTWRSEDMTYLDYLRRSNMKGAKRKNRRRVLVAAMTRSRMTDDFYGQWLVLNTPFRNVDELWDERAALVPEGYRMLALCLLKRPGLWRRPLHVQKELELAGFREGPMNNVLAMLDAHTTVIDAYLSGSLTLEEAPQPPQEHFAAPELGFQGRLEPEQAAVLGNIKEMVVWALRRRYPDEATAAALQEFLEQPESQRPRVAKPFCVLGPAGSGKSTSVEVAIRRAVEAGAHVGIACPTGMLASTYREKFPDLDVDTLHGMFLLHKDRHETWDCMANFDLVVIDEVGQLSQETFERILWLWDNADRRPALVFVGDFHQLQGMDGTRATDSARWQHVVKRHLHKMRRCRCEELKWKLELLRTAKPSKEQLHSMIRGHRAMPDRGPGYTQEPTDMDMEAMLMEWPDATFVTVTRQASAVLNELAVAALFRDEEATTIVHADYESNQENYDEFGQLRDCRPQELEIHIGMRVTLTRNINKAVGFVNGMSAEVVAVRGQTVVVRTKSGSILTVFPYTDDDIVIQGEPCRATYLPLRLGYATTLVKVQGATLSKAIFWLDKANIPAAGSVALSRVQHDADWKFIGHVTPHHFTPARGV